MPLHRVNQNRAINGESYRAGEVIDIDPSDPGWAPWIGVLTPVSSADAVGSVEAPEAKTGPTEFPEFSRVRVLEGYEGDDAGMTGAVFPDEMALEGPANCDEPRVWVVFDVPLPLTADEKLLGAWYPLYRLERIPSATDQPEGVSARSDGT